MLYAFVSVFLFYKNDGAMKEKIKHIASRGTGIILAKKAYETKNAIQDNLSLLTFRKQLTAH